MLHSLSASKYELLSRAAVYLRLPSSPHRSPEVLADGTGLRCPLSGREYPVRNGVLDLIGQEPNLTVSQKALNTRAAAWLYDRLRSTALLRLLGIPSFAVEIASIQRKQRIVPGDVVLDLACGHGNFTAELARRVAPSGLVLGMDLSPAMLARAAARVRQRRLDNVLLVRGDALNLPLADTCLAKINCSGGFHQFPDLPRALAEIARVSRPGATLTASTFAAGPPEANVSFHARAHARFKNWLHRRYQCHFLSLVRLGEQLAAVGYGEYQWSLPGGWFGYTSARFVS